MCAQQVSAVRWFVGEEMTTGGNRDDWQLRCAARITRSHAFYCLSLTTTHTTHIRQHSSTGPPLRFTPLPSYFCGTPTHAASRCDTTTHRRTRNLNEHVLHELRRCNRRRGVCALCWAHLRTMMCLVTVINGQQLFNTVRRVRPCLGSGFADWQARTAGIARFGTVIFLHLADGTMCVNACVLWCRSRTHDL